MKKTLATLSVLFATSGTMIDGHKNMDDDVRRVQLLRGHSNVGADPGAIDGFNQFISSQVPTVTAALQGVMPASYGNCVDDAPTPCEDKGDYLFYQHKSWAYKAWARWITGLNTISFDTLKVTADEEGNLNGVYGAGSFKNLPASIAIDECFTFDKCSKVWDNEDACCGSDKHFDLTLDVKCDDANKSLVYIDFGELNIDTFEITESFGPVKLAQVDITNDVHDAAKGVITDYMTKAFIPYNGTTLTITDFLNAYGRDFLQTLC